jgi:hypothetical protein
MATDKQSLQTIVAEYFRGKTHYEIVAEAQSLLNRTCIVCGRPGSSLCELHAADERTECQRQQHVEVII